MYKPGFNKVLVEIDDAEAVWGGGNDESMLGKSFRQGKVIAIGAFVSTHDNPILSDGSVPETVMKFTGKDIMWHEGAEAGTVHEVDGKQYGFIYWFDIIGIKV